MRLHSTDNSDATRIDTQEPHLRRMNSIKLIRLSLRLPEHNLAFSAKITIKVAMPSNQIAWYESPHIEMTCGGVVRCSPLSTRLARLCILKEGFTVPKNFSSPFNAILLITSRMWGKPVLGLKR